MNDFSSMTTPVDWSAAMPEPGGKPDAARIKETAKQFEALLIGQIMKSMREAGGSGWLGGGEDQSGATMTEFAEQHVAQILGSQGGFGLAALIEKGLEKAAQPQKLSDGATTGKS